MYDKDLIPLEEREVKSRLKSLSGWTYKSDKIKKTYEFASFTEAVQFINGLVMFCNYPDHHPDMIINYKKVRFELTRFDIGGKVTARDFTVAQKIEDNFQKYIKSRIE